MFPKANIVLRTLFLTSSMSIAGLLGLESGTPVYLASYAT